MDILILVVIATFIIAAVFVGYHASQTVEIEGDGESHNIEFKQLSLLENNPHTLQKTDQSLIL